LASVADVIGFRVKMIAAGYGDGNDANRLRSDPVFKCEKTTATATKAPLQPAESSSPCIKQVNWGYVSFVNKTSLPPRTRRGIGTPMNRLRLG
jgi:hypothetical protein